MIAENMKPLVKNNSVIRQMFEEGDRLRAIYGADKVFDFSLGNPNVPAPAQVKEAIIDILEHENPVKVHGYMSNAGFPEVRQAIAESLNKRFNTDFGAHNILMTVGAGSALNVAFRILLNPGDEVITFAPYFVEYGNYVSNYGGKLSVVPANTETFQPDLESFKNMVNPNTKMVVINTPHNPTGVIYSEETIRKLTDILYDKQMEYGTEIFLLSDEPYRELVYDDVQVPYVTRYYANTLVAYSFSKTLSLPGERIGYLLIPDEAVDSSEMIAAAGIAIRVSGSVNAPSLIQLVVGRCLDLKADISYYKRNRDTLYGALKEYGFSCTEPQGAFYLWVKTPTADDKEFVAAAKSHNILVVPGSSFACPGYVRLAYCVSYETIKGSLPGFRELAHEFGLA
jgi:aspartate aminotransferase